MVDYSININTFSRHHIYAEQRFNWRNYRDMESE